jgi:branched-chain amino acid transport system substrate-binding protein
LASAQAPKAKPKPAAQSRPQPAPTGPVVIGAVVSESGPLADLAADYRRGLLAWQDTVNAGGGLLGRSVDLKLVDDGSEAARTGPLYAELVQVDKAELLIGPYGSAATRVAGAEAERQRRVMVNGAGPAQVVQRGGSHYLFQVSAPYGAYGEGVLALAKARGLKRLYILARDEIGTLEMAEGTRLAAVAQGFIAGAVESYKSSTLNFEPLVQKARAAGAEGWIAFGEVRDAAEMVKTFKKIGYAPQLFFARRSSAPEFVKLVGQDAEFALGLSEYGPRWKTASNEEFVAAFSAKWSAPPSAAAAEAWAAATVLAEAVRRAGSFAQDAVRAELGRIEAQTVLGPYRVDTASGEQLGIRPAVTQIQRGRAQVVWPPALVTGQPVQPYPQWADRVLYTNKSADKSTK